MATLVRCCRFRTGGWGSDKTPSGVPEARQITGEGSTEGSAIQKESLAEAFNYLKERLDPEEDEFLAAANFRRMTWIPGEAVQDFFARYLEEAIKAKLTPRAACTFMVSQAPLKVQQKLKDWVKQRQRPSL